MKAKTNGSKNDLTKIDRRILLGSNKYYPENCFLKLKHRQTTFPYSSKQETKTEL